MTNPGKKIFLLTAFMFVAAYLHAADISAELDSNRIAPGESATLSIKVTGGNVSPDSLPKVDGLSIQFAGNESRFEYINGKTWKGTVLKYSIRTNREGDFTIPAITVSADGKKISSSPVLLQVSKKFARRASRSSLPRGFGGFQGLPGIFGEDQEEEPSTITGVIQIPRKNLYTGEAVLVRYTLSSSRNIPFGIRGFQERPSFKGFLVKDLSFNGSNQLKEDNAFSYLLVPQSEGRFQINGGKVVVSVQSEFGDKVVEYPVATITVKDLPSVGRPANFSGNVGSFAIFSDLSDATCRAYDEKRFTVTIKGEGNFMGLKRPEFANLPDGVRALYEDGQENISYDKEIIQGEKIFYITLIPEREGEFRIGDLTLNYFNPASSSYGLTHTQPATLIVKGIAEKKESKSSVGGSVARPVVFWIFGGVAFLALFVGGVILYERKKYGRIETAKEEKTEIAVETARQEKDHERREMILILQRASVAQDPSEFFRVAEQLVSLEKNANPRNEKLDSIAREINAIRYSGRTADSASIRSLKERILSALK